MQSQRPPIVAKHIWEKMSAQDQKRYGHAHVSAKDIEKWHKGLEKEMHNQFASWLHRNGFYKKYIHARPDKKTGIGVGTFDFTVWRAGRIAFVEFKTDKGRMSDPQKDFYAAQVDEGTPALVAHHYLEAVRFIEEVFAL